MNCSVLVVDDDDSVRKSILRTLSAAGIDAVGAGDASEALQLALLHTPHLFIVDLHLASGHGNDAVRILRSCFSLQGIPAIALSAAPEEAAPSLFETVLSKPCETKTLLGAIRRSLERASGAYQYSAAEQDQLSCSRTALSTN